MKAEEKRGGMREGYNRQSERDKTERERWGGQPNAVSRITYEMQVATQLHTFVLLITSTIKGCVVPFFFPFSATCHLSLLLSVCGCLSYRPISHSATHAKSGNICDDNATGFMLVSALLSFCT